MSSSPAHSAIANAADALTLGTAAAALESLGNPRRLAVFRLLVRAGTEGAPVGHIQQELDFAASTLTHHISHLVRAGLVRQQREGRVLRCFAEFRTMSGLLDYLMAECCQGAGSDDGGRCR